MLRERIFGVAICTVLLSACGGEGTVKTGAPLPSQSERFPATVLLTTSQTAGLFQWRRSTKGLFDTLNTAPTMTAIPAVIADYEGQMLAQIGTQEAYLGGDIIVRLDFNSGNGFGSVNNLDISGREATHPDLSGNLTTNRQLSSFDSLDVTLTSVTPTTVTGTITGSADDSFLFTSNVETHVVDATLDGSLVQDPTNNNILTAFVGSVAGTITTNGRQNTLDGIVAAQETAGTGVGLP